MSNPISDIHPNSNGGSHVLKASTVRTLDKLEIRVRALSLHPKDIILIQFVSQPSIDEMLDLQRNIGHMMNHLKLDFPVFWMLIPPGLTLTQLDPVEIEKMGWIRKENSP